MNLYALTHQAMIGQDWLTVEEVARLAGLPVAATNHALIELVGEGSIRVDIRNGDGTGTGELVYKDRGPQWSEFPRQRPWEEDDPA